MGEFVFSKTIKRREINTIDQYDEKRVTQNKSQALQHLPRDSLGSPFLIENLTPHVKICYNKNNWNQWTRKISRKRANFNKNKSKGESDVKKNASSKRRNTQE